MAEDIDASSGDGGTHNGNSAGDNNTNVAYFSLQPHHPAVTNNDYYLGTNQGMTMMNSSTIVGPTGSAAPPATVHPQILSMLEAYRIPPYTSLSLDQIALALAQASSVRQIPPMTTPVTLNQASHPPAPNLNAAIPAMTYQRPEASAPAGTETTNALGNLTSLINSPNHGSQQFSLTNEAPSRNPTSTPLSYLPVNNNQVAQSNTTGPVHVMNFCKVLQMPQDENHLSQYQCLVRKQIELFQATEQDLSEKSQGRNRPIILGQVGIRCRYCGSLPSKERAKGGKFFPSNLDALYQTAQNMANTHLLLDCKEIPVDVREDMLRVRCSEKKSKTCKSSYGNGRTYWSNCLRVMGIVATEDRRLRLSNIPRTDTQGSTPPPSWYTPI